MRGLDEARLFYEQQGRAMLRERFGEVEGRIAVGLAGHGSQCFGFDDAVSRDHDFDRGFCLWLTASAWRSPAPIASCAAGAPPHKA